MDKNKKKFIINTEIRYRKVRIVGDDVESKVCDIDEALRISSELGMDLILVNETNPPVCRICDYGKFLYEEKRKKKELDKKNRKNIVEVKEIRLTPNTDKHDFDFKSKNSIKFLKEGNKVKVVVVFSGREMAFKERGEKLILEFTDNLSEYGLPENLPKMEGKKMILIIKPKK
jgi:translation initiation factor IF-3